MLNLCNLRCLQLRDCGSLECLFTYSTAQTMISLKVLKVKDCRILKYIATFEKEEDFFSTTVMFPKLRDVRIAGCDMRYTGPTSLAGGLGELEIIKIKDAPQLEYVFGKYKHGIIQSLKIDLPALKVFKLTNLPKITSIAPENCKVSCPSLARLHIRGCPNLISMSGLDLKESQQSDDEAKEQDLRPLTQLSHPMIEPATNMESNSELEGFPQDYKSSDKREARVIMEEERCHDDYDVDKDEKEAGQDKGEKSGIPVDNNQVIEQGAISCVDSRELDKGSLEIEKGSFHNNPVLEESKEGTSTLELIEKQPNVEPQLPLVLEDQQQALEEYKAEDFHEVQVAAEVPPQSQKLDVIDETQEGFQEHNPNPVDSMNLRESSTKIGKGSLHNDAGLEEPKVETSTQVQDAREVHPQSKVFDVISDTQEGLQEQNFCSIGSMNSIENNMEIANVLIDKQAQVVIDPQQALQDYKVLSPSTTITTSSPTSEALFSSSIRQQEELADFQGLSRHAHFPDAPHQQKCPEYDSRSEVQEAANIHVQSHTGSNHSNEDRDKENQRGNNDIPRGSITAGSNFQLMKQDGIAAEVHPLEGLQKQKLCTVDSMNLQESNTEIAKLRLRKDPASEESTVGTSSQVMIDKQAQVVTDPQHALQDYRAPRQQKLPEDDSHSEVKEAANIHVQSQNFDIISETHESFRKHHFYPVGSINLTESNNEITKGSLHSPKESTTRTSSQKLIEKQPQLELVLPQVETYQQQAFSQNNLLPLPQPVHPTLEAPTSSLMKQPSIAEELADFHGIARRACLLEEAFVKYPHLWNWKISQKSSRLCKWGYESLTDMLELLKSEKPKTMDDSKIKKFEDLCLELESFGFDKEWLASIRQRVMAKLVDHSDKLKQLVQLKSDVSSLEDQLNDARARMNSIEHNLSKLDDVFGL